MSVAGKRSFQGDEYQILIGLKWAIQLLTDDDLDFIQLESTGIPEIEGKVTVDDIIIFYKNGIAKFIQAKKNQPENMFWSFNDKILQQELIKAKSQLEKYENSKIYFYSRSPWGEIKTFSEYCHLFSCYEHFKADDVNKHTENIKKLSSILSSKYKTTFNFIKKVFFIMTNDYEDLEKDNEEKLNYVLPTAQAAIDVLRTCLTSHQASLPGSPFKLYREDLLTALREKGISPTKFRKEAEIIENFSKASIIGRHDIIRSIGGKHIQRPEVDTIIELIQKQSRTILLTSGPGTGKTCVILDLADRIESILGLGLLFIKGDRFAGLSRESDLVAEGLPEDIAGQCARLAEKRQVIVLIDSLDVLSLGRSHRSLGYFLNLLDQLAYIKNVTTVVACRSFDLKYDPMLQGQEWEYKIEILPLDYERDVVPLLIQWSIDPEGIDINLRTLLQNPRLLSLFEQLVKVNGNYNVTTAHDLHNKFFEEVILKGEGLGLQAMNVLQTMATNCMNRRQMSMPKALVTTSEDIIRCLESVNAVNSTPDGRIGFHQTMGECLAVRHALSQGKSLSDFVKEFPQLPFIRPAVRAFFNYLRSYDVIGFHRQISTVIASSDIAYHLKRLICESLGEISPREDDIPLVLRLFREDQELFKRMLWHAKALPWFDVLTNHWLKLILGSSDKDLWLREFSDKVREWMNDLPRQVIGVWILALEQADVGENINWTIAVALEKFKQWNTDNVEKLLHLLKRQNIGDSHDLRLKPVSMWVEATGKGDDFIWELMTENILPEDANRYNLGNKLICDDYNFCRKDFFEKRLKKSDNMMDIAVRNLEKWCLSSEYTKINDTFNVAFLHESSWENIHSVRDISHVDALSTFLNALEDAFVFHSKANDSWWILREPELRESKYSILLYFLIKSYLASPETNINGIEDIFQNINLFRYGSLEYEIGILMNKCYHLISYSVQESNQNMINNLYSDCEDDELNGSQKKHKYKFLKCIPVIFQTETTVKTLQNATSELGDFRPTPRIVGAGGVVNSPISLDCFIKLSDNSILRLLQHYNDYHSFSEIIDGQLIGDRSEVEWTLQQAASIDPFRFLNFLQKLTFNKLSSAYFSAIKRGVANHLDYRFGKLHPPEYWKAVDPLPDRLKIGKYILTILEHIKISNDTAKENVDLVKSCCSVLDTIEYSKRLVDLIKKYFVFLSMNHEENQDDFESQGLNAPLGVLTSCIMILCNFSLKNKVTIDINLQHLLESLSLSAYSSVKSRILAYLPYTIQEAPDFGWLIFDNIIQGMNPKLWNIAEHVLYYNTSKNFLRIKRYLDKIYADFLTVAGVTWGRISTLSVISGLLSSDVLFNSLASCDKEVWKVVARIFSHNIENSDYQMVCSNGLIRLLNEFPRCPEVLSEVSHLFSITNLPFKILHGLSLEYLKHAGQVDGDCGIYYFINCLPILASHDPHVALEVINALADSAENRQDKFRFDIKKELIRSSFLTILREADELNDDKFIHDVISVQDRFLKMEIGDIESIYEQAG